VFDSKSTESLWAHDNLAAWLVVPPSYDSKARGPEARRGHAGELGFKHYVFRSEQQQDAATYDGELNALQKHGIDLLAWRTDYGATILQLR